MLAPGALPYVAMGAQPIFYITKVSTHVAQQGQTGKGFPNTSAKPGANNSKVIMTTDPMTSNSVVCYDHKFVHFVSIMHCTTINYSLPTV